MNKRMKIVVLSFLAVLGISIPLSLSIFLYRGSVCSEMFPWARILLSLLFAALSVLSVVYGATQIAIAANTAESETEAR